MVAVAPCAGLDRLQVGAGARFGHGDGGHELATREAREPIALLLLVAIGEDVVRDGALDRGAEVHAGLGQLLQHHGFVGEGPAAAAVVFRHVGEQDAGAAGIGPGMGVGTMLLAPARLVRHELVLDELTRGLAEHPHVLVHPRRLVTGGCGHFLSGMARHRGDEAGKR